MSMFDEAQSALGRLWWLVMLFGAAVFCVGIFFVASPHETLSTFTVIAGIFLLIDGLLAIGTSIFSRREGRGMLALIGVLSAIAGLVLVKKPFGTLIVFVLVIGVWFIVAGVVRFVAALGEPEGRASSIAIAVLDVIAGIVILSWPGIGVATLAVIIGIVLIVRGALFFVAGWELRRLGHEVRKLTERHIQQPDSRALSGLSRCLHVGPPNPRLIEHAWDPRGGRRGRKSETPIQTVKESPC